MPHPEPRFTPPPPDCADKVLSALAGVLFLGAWAAAYVVAVPAEPHRPLHVAAAQVKL